MGGVFLLVLRLCLGTYILVALPPLIGHRWQSHQETIPRQSLGTSKRASLGTSKTIKSHCSDRFQALPPLNQTCGRSARHECRLINRFNRNQTFHSCIVPSTGISPMLRSINITPSNRIIMNIFNFLR